MVAVESSASNAMHSEMDRRGGIGAWITATGSLPLSITTSAPARTRASSPAKSLAASASEMWITWSTTQRLHRYFPCSDSASKAASSFVRSSGATFMCTPSVIPGHAPDAAAVAEACAPCTDKSCGLPASRCFQKIVAPLRSPRARISWNKGCGRSIGRHRHLCSIHSRQEVHASCRRVRGKPEAWSTRVCHTPKAGFAPSTLKSCSRVFSLNNAGT